jgi:hypothetical protein
MFSDFKYILIVSFVMLSACGQYAKLDGIRDGRVSLGLSVADDAAKEPFADKDVVIDSIRSALSDEPLLMKAVKDTETGEMVATDVICASRVVARFRNVAERDGHVSISFDITVPNEMTRSGWQLRVLPYMRIQSDTVALEPIYITGQQYRGKQLRGYERYHKFLSTILTNPEDFLRLGQLEILLQRHFPETYSMKTDSSFVSDPDAQNLFGVTQHDALEHYKRELKWRRNERRKGLRDKKFEEFVKDPIPSSGVRLDTVFVSPQGEFTYRYTHTFRSRPGLRKVNVYLHQQLYEDGECIIDMPFQEELTFYISSLSSLVEDKVMYLMAVNQRRVYDHTSAFIDFEYGSAVVDTSLSENAAELFRVRQCIDDVLSRKDLALDSIVVTASCSPEGRYDFNRALSEARSRSVCDYVAGFVSQQWRDSLKTSYVPENWDQFIRIVENDTVLSRETRRKMVILVMNMEGEPDRVEEKLSMMPEYRYLRERIYPKLRNVRFDFHMHRKGVVQDTVMTTVQDTVYKAGLDALRELDYRRAVTLLRPYGDYNAALALTCADYNHTALEVLGHLDIASPKVCYLKAIVLSRLGQYEEALKYFELAVINDSSMAHRANLDPEMSVMVKRRQNLEL